jgi:hypothetical protein
MICKYCQSDNILIRGKEGEQHRYLCKEWEGRNVCTRLWNRYEERLAFASQENSKDNALNNRKTAKPTEVLCQ